LNGPVGIEVRPDGVLWVGDTSNNRTLSFVPPFTPDMSASQVLGQPDFSQNQPNQSSAAPSDRTQYLPFENPPVDAGGSFLAVAVLVMLAVGREIIVRRRRKVLLAS